MAHWQAVLPEDRLLDVDYESLVADRTVASRRLLDAVGLPWSKSCLRPESNPRPVRTATVWQARQPVYTTSVGRHTRYQAWLGALCELAPATG